MNLSAVQKERIEQLKQSNFFKFAQPDACFCCGGSQFKTLLNEDRYGFPLHYVACEGCGFIFANPYYTADCLNEFYSEQYGVIYGRSGNVQSMFKDEYINGVESIWPLVKKFINIKEGTVLDYGCAHGGSLMAFPQTWKRIGYDYDPSQMEYGKSYGLDLREMQYFADCKELCDVITLNQVLEHTHDPVANLRMLAKLLKDDGILYLEVPSLDAICKSSQPILAFKNAHRHFFCIDSLQKIAEQAGFKLLYAEETVSPFNGKRGALRAILCKLSSPLSKNLDIKTNAPVISASEWTAKIIKTLHNPSSSLFRRLSTFALVFPIRTIRWCRRKLLCKKLVMSRF